MYWQMDAARDEQVQEHCIHSAVSCTLLPGSMALLPGAQGIKGRLYSTATKACNHAHAAKSTQQKHAIMRMLRTLYS